MIRESIELGVGSAATLETYVIQTPEGATPGIRRPLAIVCPGGGYGHLSTREGEPIALALVGRGISACVLGYSVTPATYPQALRELARATAVARSRAEAWEVDPDRILACGFSAGGHLAGCLAASWSEPWLAESVGAAPDDVRPNGLVLGYPVVSSGAFGHRGSFERLCGGDEALSAELSLERRVTEDWPPTFLWHTAEDATVPVENSLALAAALSEKNVPFSLHVFPRGDHGASLGVADTALAGRPGHVQAQVKARPDLLATWVAEL